MRKDPKHVSWHSTCGKHIQKLHCLHLEAKIAVYHEQNDICDFRNVDHAREGVRGTFYEGKAAFFGGHNGERAARV